MPQEKVTVEDARKFEIEFICKEGIISVKKLLVFGLKPSGVLRTGFLFFGKHQ